MPSYHLSFSPTSAASQPSQAGGRASPRVTLPSEGPYHALQVAWGSPHSCFEGREIYPYPTPFPVGMGLEAHLMSKAFSSKILF